MRACQSCGTLFDDDAQFCNRCHTELNDQSTEQVIDQNDYIELVKISKNSRKWSRYLLFSLAIILPFFIYWSESRIFTQPYEKIIYLGVLELITILALYFYQKRKVYITLLVTLGVLFLGLPPIGIIICIGLLFSVALRGSNDFEH